MESLLSIHASKFGWRASCAGAALLLLSLEGRANALQWAGRSWEVTNGGMAGVAKGSPANVSVDNDGYLHLKITKNGNTWTAAEIFTTEKLGFGTYQWQIDGPIDHLDKQVVVGMYPYGPAAGIGEDGTNEIDIEYSFWGHADGPNGDWTDYPASGNTIGEMTYKFSLNGGTLSTSRVVWSTSKIANYLIKGLQPVGSTTDLINSWTYAPNNSKVNIPQQALPLGINLWCFEAPPSDGKNVEIVFRSFQFVPEGTVPPGGMAGAGAGGASSMGGASASGGSAGAHPTSGGSGGTSGNTGNGTAGRSDGGSSGTLATAGGPGAGGANAAAGGSTSNGAAGSASTAGGSLNVGSAGHGPSAAAGSSTTATAGSSATAGNTDGDQESSCSVGAAGTTRGSRWFGLTVLPLFVLARQLRRRSRSRAA